MSQKNVYNGEVSTRYTITCGIYLEKKDQPKVLVVEKLLVVSVR